MAGSGAESRSARDWYAICISTFVMDPLAPKLEHYLDLLAARQKLVSANIANADTPGYRTQDIDFQFEFLSFMENEPGASNPHVIEPEGLKGKNDGNNVSLDRESRLLAENAMRFNFAGSLLRDRIKAVRTAIQEAGKV